MLENPFITMTTDFGLKDPFAGIMKGVILKINPKVSILDLTHNIQRHNIFEASQALLMSYKYFPPATIHLAIVDPGVGSSRRPILVVTEDHYFIGPDNGIFSSIYNECTSHFLKVFHITASHYFLPMSGSTFHGRDIFAPVAAWLSKGVASHKFGDEIDDYTKIELPAAVLSENSISGEIVTIDNFGNAISNITKNELAELGSRSSQEKLKVTFNNELLPLVQFYAENKTDRLAAIINSFEHLELFASQENASSKFNIKIGDIVIVKIL